MAYGIIPDAILEREPKDCEADGAYVFRDPGTEMGFVVLVRFNGEWFGMARAMKLEFNQFVPGTKVLGPLK